jgi:ABC-2 type transport system ATP-binding protein
MQQKVALARALLTSPVLLLLDEPTTGLDPRSKREVQAFISSMRETHDTTVLLCTHDMEEAEALAERVGILHAGRLLALEPTPQLLRKYGASDLNEVFFTATGKALAEDSEDSDELEEVEA